MAAGDFGATSPAINSDSFRQFLKTVALRGIKVALGMFNKLPVLATVLIVSGLLGLAQDRAPATDATKVAPVYRVGDRIEGYNLGWYAGVVTEIGSGKNQGEYLIKYDKFSTSQWFSAKNLRSTAAADADRAKTATLAATASQGPRVGKYDIFSYGAVGTVRLYLGHVEIMAGQKYRVSRTSAGNYFGEGSFTFDSAARKI